MSDEKPTYDIVPEGTETGATPIPPVAAPTGAAARQGTSEPALPAARVAKIDAPALVTDEVEDEFDAAEKAAATAAAATSTPADKPSALVRAGWDQPRYMLILGGAAALAAGVMAWVNSTVPGTTAGFARLLLAMYTTGLHAGLGVVAVMVSAFLLGRAVGPIEFAAGRMLAAVGLFQVFVHLNVGSVYSFEEVLLGAAAYLGVVFATFRWKKEDLAVVIAAHFGLWLAMQIGMWLTAWVHTAPAAAAGTGA